MRKLGMCMLMLALGGCLVQADVDLEWRLPPSLTAATTVVGDVIEVDLYAVASGAVDEPFCAAQIIVTWDETRLTLLGNEDAEPGTWMLSGFPDDHGLDGLNESFDDGDAYYHLWCWLGGPPAVATPDGLYVTTFQFVAIAPGDAWIDIIDACGWHSVTAVLDEAIPGWNIVGEFGEIDLTITVRPEPPVSALDDKRDAAPLP